MNWTTQSLCYFGRADNDYHIARLERSAIGLAELYRQMHGIVRGTERVDQTNGLLMNPFVLIST